MKKAHLVEALYLVNQGTDEAVRGLERLKKAAGFKGEIYGGSLARMEHERAQVNLQFFDDMHSGEEKDAAHYERSERETSGKDSER